MDRREFIRKSALSASLVVGSELAQHAIPFDVLADIRGGGVDIDEALDMLEEGKKTNTAPQIRPEIRNNPRAVFLIDTQVSADPDKNGCFSTAAPQLQDAGRKVASLVFVKGTQKGGSTWVKPNLTGVPDESFFPEVGINTSPNFMAGFIEGLHRIGNTNVMVGDRGGNARRHRGTGQYAAFDPKNITLVEPSYAAFAGYSPKQLNWHKVPNSVVWKNIPTYRPLGDPDNFFINMPKLKAHNLGMATLAVKNLQGAVVKGYGHYCDQWAALQNLAEKAYLIDFKRDFVEDYQQRVEAAFLKHRAAGFKYWDYEQSYPKYEAKGGWEAFKKIRSDTKNVNDFMKGVPNLMWDEQWCQRAMDSAAAIKPSINIIEGVIGRDGSGFAIGRDQLCNIVVVGMSPFEVDTVGSWIMGHDPLELYFTRIFKERGMGENDPRKIEIYRIADSGIDRVKDISEIKRYKLGVNIHTHLETGKRLFW
jgi:uncharacterized protein (DUF362 family)